MNLERHRGDGLPKRTAQGYSISSPRKTKDISLASHPKVFPSTQTIGIIPLLGLYDQINSDRRTSWICLAEPLPLYLEQAHTQASRTFCIIHTKRVQTITLHFLLGHMAFSTATQSKGAPWRSDSG